MALIQSIEHPSRVHDVRFSARPDGEGEVLLVAGEDKKISVYELHEISPDNVQTTSKIASDEDKGEEAEVEVDTPTSQYAIVAEFIGHENRCVYYRPCLSVVCLIFQSGLQRQIN